MVLPVKIMVKRVLKEELFEAYKAEEVLTYCQRCSNYEKNHSCPDFDFNAVDYLAPYQYATMILTEIDTKPIQVSIERLDPISLKSRTSEYYFSEAANEIVDLPSLISMYAFERLKDEMADKLLALEQKIDHSVGLPPGSCTRCDICTKQLGEPCRFPETLRYSLEALGFLVSDLYKRCFGLELDWTKGELPESLWTCSVLMTNEWVPEGMVVNNVKGMTFEIDELAADNDLS